MIQILMPMAGSAKPFRDKGETFPKALIEILGQPLAAYAVQSSRPKDNHSFIFVVDSESAAQFHIEPMLNVLSPNCAVVRAISQTGGALCTCLLAIDHIVLDQPLIVCNGDQYLSDGVDGALTSFRERGLDVGIITFPSVHPRWSFVRKDSNGFVVETAEKKPISDEATVGVYYYSHAKIFLESAKKSLLKHVTNNEQFFVVPSINQVILDGGRVGSYLIDKSSFYPLGIPEDLEQFLHHFQDCPLQ